MPHGGEDRIAVFQIRQWGGLDDEEIAAVSVDGGRLVGGGFRADADDPRVIALVDRGVIGRIAGARVYLPPEAPEPTPGQVQLATLPASGTAFVRATVDMSTARVAAQAGEVFIADVGAPEIRALIADEALEPAEPDVDLAIASLPLREIATRQLVLGEGEQRRRERVELERRRVAKLRAAVGRSDPGSVSGKKAEAQLAEAAEDLRRAEASLGAFIEEHRAERESLAAAARHAGRRERYEEHERAIAAARDAHRAADRRAIAMAVELARVVADRTAAAERFMGAIAASNRALGTRRREALPPSVGVDGLERLADSRGYLAELGLRLERGADGHWTVTDSGDEKLAR